MFFQKSDKENIQKILASSEGNKIQLHHLSSEIADLSRILRRVESVIDQLTNDFETLKSRMISLEHKCNTPTTQITASKQPPKKKK